jgi:hypothetical protein
MYIVNTELGLCFKMDVGDYTVSTSFDEPVCRICDPDNIRVFHQRKEEVTLRIFGENNVVANDENLMKAIEWCKGRMGK